MIFLLLAILSSVMISVLMRISSKYISANLSMLAVNYLVCTLLGAVYSKFQLIVPQNPEFWRMVWFGIFSGFLYLGGFVLFQYNVRKNGVVLSATFMKLGLLVPVGMSMVCFREMPSVIQIVGFLMALAAIVLMNLKKDESKGQFGGGLILMLFMCGGSDAMAKVFERMCSGELSDTYLFYTFATAVLLCMGMVLYQKEKPGMAEVFFGTIIGIPNFFSSKFLLGALMKLPAVVVYPSFSVGTLLIVTLTGVEVFKERLSKVQWLAMGGIVAALVFLNV